MNNITSTWILAAVPPAIAVITFVWRVSISRSERLKRIEQDILIVKKELELLKERSTEERADIKERLEQFMELLMKRFQ